MTTRTPRRQRKWLNEQNSDTLTGGTQDDFTIATTGFDKGETVERMLISVSTDPVTQSALVQVTLAIWVGQFGGIPTDISADSPESYMLWDGYLQETAGAGGERIHYRTYDLKGKRASRSDSENIHFVYRVSAASDLRVDVWSRVLILLP